MFKNTVLAAALLASTFTAQAATQQDQCSALVLAQFFMTSSGLWTAPADDGISFKTAYRSLEQGKFSARFTDYSTTSKLNYVVVGTCDNNGKNITLTSIKDAGNVPNVDTRLVGGFDEQGTLRATDGKYSVVITGTK